VSNITLPRAVVWRLHAAFRDADKTIRPSGEKSDYSAEIAASCLLKAFASGRSSLSRSNFF
jgi:hypothetical protein